ncbi:7478_t:CDS:2 [Racocetra persica]|uniref:7478_t:CDS:1 n=1 Tax=Racocetra persica TaxID=160502 RepID=A0ACA9QUM9_9GLOM|nr:7478_t:CDS:2 [Racocetra persica]
MNNILKPSDTIDTSTVECEHTFSTFAKAYNSYKQALFVYEKQEKYTGNNDAYTTKRIGYSFAISIYYRKHDKEFAITKLCLKHNHDPCSDATKFSSVIKKLDQNNLKLIEKLHNDRLRTKNIFLVLNSVSTKYIHKPDVYNTISCQRQLKLKGLSEIKILLKNLREDKNIIDDIALKNIFNDE